MRFSLGEGRGQADGQGPELSAEQKMPFVTECLGSDGSGDSRDRGNKTSNRAGWPRRVAAGQAAPHEHSRESLLGATVLRTLLTLPRKKLALPSRVHRDPFEDLDA